MSHRGWWSGWGHSSQPSLPSGVCACFIHEGTKGSLPGGQVASQGPRHWHEMGRLLVSLVSYPRLGEAGAARSTTPSGLPCPTLCPCLLCSDVAYMSAELASILWPCPLHPFWTPSASQLGRLDPQGGWTSFTWFLLSSRKQKGKVSTNLHPHHQVSTTRSQSLGLVQFSPGNSVEAIPA